MALHTYRNDSNKKFQLINLMFQELTNIKNFLKIDGLTKNKMHEFRSKLFIALS